MSERTTPSFFNKYPLFIVEMISRFYPLSSLLLEKYEDHWHWEGISHNIHLKWTLELLQKYRCKLDWAALSSGIRVPDIIEGSHTNTNQWDEINQQSLSLWSFESLDKFQDMWDWNKLSQNEGLPWSVKLLDRFKERWNWYHLSKNRMLPWSITMIEKFKHEWDWFELSSQEYLPWSIELIEWFESYWHWEHLVQNKKLPWSIELLEKFVNYWDWESLKNRFIYHCVFQPLLNQQMVEQIMNDLDK